MKYLRNDLREEYERIAKNVPDIEGLQHPLINFSDVLHAYFILADYFTDESSDNIEHMLVGLRSADLLGSALGRQIVSFGGRKKYTDSIEICATLFYGLVKDHAFHDGNKRTALLTLLYQLTLYGYIPSVSVNKYEKLVVAVAAHTVEATYPKEWKKFKKCEEPEIQTIAYLLRQMTKKKDNSYHISPTMKEFCAALENADVSYEASGSKMHFTRVEYSMWKLKKEKYQYTIPFNGWTRTVGAKTARDTLQALKIYDQYATYQTSVYKGYKQDKIEMRGDRAEMSDFPLYLNMVAGGLDRRDQTISGFSFVVKIYAVPVVEIIG